MAYSFDYEAFVKRLKSNPEAQNKLNSNMFTVSAMPIPGDTPYSLAANTS